MGNWMERGSGIKNYIKIYMRYVCILVWAASIVVGGMAPSADRAFAGETGADGDAARADGAGADAAKADAASTADASKADASKADASAGRAVSGVIDLTDGVFRGEGWTPLDGEWEMHWNALLSPEETAKRDRLAAYVTVPGAWSGYTLDGRALSNQGYATYRLTVRLSETDARRTMGIYMPSVATAYRLWIDGVEYGGNGEVGTSRERMTPKNVPRAYYFRPAGTEVEFVIQVSNFVQRKGGLWESIRFGYSESISRLRNGAILQEAIVLGCIVFMGIYHLGLYLHRRKDPAPLYFAGICLAFGARMSFLGETLAVFALPGIPWEVGVKVEYVAALAAVALLVCFTCAQYPKEADRRTRSVLLALNGAVGLFVLATPASVYTEYMVHIAAGCVLPTMLYVLYVYGVAAMRRRPGSVLNGVGFLLIAGAIVYDVMFYSQWVSFGNVLPYGVLFALLTQSLNVAGTFSRAFLRSERLAVELRRSNDYLEDKVESRTMELLEANRRLEQRNVALSELEASRRQLLSTISHELGTPLTSIQGYIKLMLDGVVPTTDERVLRLVYDKTVVLDRMIQDLFDLSRLEARQLRFRRERVPADVFLRKLIEGSAMTAGNRPVAVEWVGADALCEGESARTFDIDPIRIEQVFANLMVNANKFSPKGGTVRVRIETVSMPGTGEPAVKVAVADEGVGIPEDELPYIFDRFYRGSSSIVARPDGAGLGLAIARQIIEQHQGVIGVKSVPNKGSTFYFLLPLYSGAGGES